MKTSAPQINNLNNEAYHLKSLKLQSLVVLSNHRHLIIFLHHYDKFNDTRASYCSKFLKNVSAT